MLEPYLGQWGGWGELLLAWTLQEIQVSPDRDHNLCLPLVLLFLPGLVLGVQLPAHRPALVLEGAHLAHHPWPILQIVSCLLLLVLSPIGHDQRLVLSPGGIISTPSSQGHSLCLRFRVLVSQAHVVPTECLPPLVSLCPPHQLTC